MVAHTTLLEISCLGSFGKQTVKIQIRYCIMQCLIWVCTATQKVGLLYAAKYISKIINQYLLFCIYVPKIINIDFTKQDSHEGL